MTKFVRVADGRISGSSVPARVAFRAANLAYTGEDPAAEVREMLRVRGWYPLVDERPRAGVDYDPEKQGVNGPLGTELGDPIPESAVKVVVRYEVRDLTRVELVDRWERRMVMSDDELISRALEDHLEADHGGRSASPELQRRYDDKKTLRTARPV